MRGIGADDAQQRRRCERRGPSVATLTIGSWVHSPAHGESVRILDVETVWNHSVYQIWIPKRATVERVPTASLLSPPTPCHCQGDDVKMGCDCASLPPDLLDRVLLGGPARPSHAGTRSRSLAGADRGELARRLACP